MIRARFFYYIQCCPVLLCVSTRVDSSFDSCMFPQEHSDESKKCTHRNTCIDICRITKCVSIFNCCHCCHISMSCELLYFRMVFIHKFSLMTSSSFHACGLNNTVMYRKMKITTWFKNIQQKLQFFLSILSKFLFIEN